MLLFLLACSRAPVGQEKELAELFENYWEERSRLFPIEAMQQGDNRYNHTLPNDQTAEFREGLREFYTRYHAGLQRFDRQKLSENDRVSFDVFDYEMRTQLEALSLNSWMIPFQQFWGLHLTMGQLGSGTQYQPFKTVEDYRNWAERVRAFSSWADAAIENFRAGMKSGVVLPRVLVKKILPQLDKLIVKSPEKSIFWGPIKNFPADFSEADRVALESLYRQLIITQVTPTFRKLHDFLHKEYLPRARSTHGITAIPGGKETYAHLVRYWTTSDMTPEEIHAIGLKEVARIRGEMERVKSQVGFKGTLKQFFASLRTNPRLKPFRTEAEILSAFGDIHTRMKPQLESMFSLVPKTPFEIRQTEKFREKTASAEYVPGSPDGSRPGIFYLPIINPREFNVTSGMESLFLHEAIPGHHYQISLQQENETLPKFRRFAWYGAYGEGWALYCESLGKELGLYTDPYQYLGALGDEMHRAIRLVVDPAIHVMGMSRDEAIQYMMDNEQIDLQGATAEIERYMAIPGQALSYKVGSLKIRELREKYAAELGDKFSLAAFHDEFLKDGGLPLKVIEAKMDEWARARKAGN
jgi:uncharacterized protein (DUF885 family)